MSGLNIPEIAWRGHFADYRDLVKDTTEASDNFHFAVFLQIMGCTLGRRLRVYHANWLYPNFYTCLVGISGATRKDTCANRGRDILERLNKEEAEGESPTFRMISGIRSPEGLLDELAGNRRVRLVVQGEFAALLGKAKQDSNSTLVPTLTELYDCKKQVNPPVRGKPADCREPFLGIIAGTTGIWLRKALSLSDIQGGFANRWLYFTGIPERAIPHPPKVDEQKQSSLVKELNTIRMWAEDTEEIKVSPEAEELFNDWYYEYFDRCQQESLLSTLIAREQDHLWKVAMLFAASDMSSEIEAEHMNAAISVAGYLEKAVLDVFSTFEMGSAREKDEKLLSLLRSEGQPVLKREIYRRLSLSASQLDKVLEPLKKVGVVREYEKRNGTGPRGNVIEAI